MASPFHESPRRGNRTSRSPVNASDRIDKTVDGIEMTERPPSRPTSRPTSRYASIPDSLADLTMPIIATQHPSYGADDLSPRRGGGSYQPPPIPRIQGLYQAYNSMEVGSNAGAKYGYAAPLASDPPVSAGPTDSILLSRNKTPLDDDNFLIHAYEYYYQRGIFCICVQKIVNLLIFLFLLAFLVIMTSFVNYTMIPNITKETTLSMLFTFSWSRIPIFTWILACFMLLFWFINTAQFIHDIPELIRLHTFFTQSLGIQHLDHTDWNTVMERMALIKPMSVQEVTARIMRKENYIIALFNRNVMNLHIFTLPVQWAISYGVINMLMDGDTPRVDVFDRRYRQYYANKLRKRMLIHGIIFLILSPFIFCYLLLYYSFSYFDRIRNSPSLMGDRMWSPYALILFREFNEAPHYFHDRVNKAKKCANDYLAQFPSHILSIGAQFVSFQAGALLAVILLMGAINDQILLNVTLWGRTLFVIAGILSVILAATRGLLPDEIRQPEPQKDIDSVAEFCHYHPRVWSDGMSKAAHDELSRLFQYRIVLFAYNMASVILAPIILIAYLPDRAEAILDFMERFTVYDSKVGYICSLASFDRLAVHGNPKFGAPVVANVQKEQQTKHGKLEKSIMTFAQNHRKWEMPDNCRQLIDNVQEYLKESAMSNPAVNARSMMHSINVYHDAQRSGRGMDGSVV